MSDFMKKVASKHPDIVRQAWNSVPLRSTSPGQEILRRRTLVDVYHKGESLGLADVVSVSEVQVMLELRRGHESYSRTIVLSINPKLRSDWRLDVVKEPHPRVSGAQEDLEEKYNLPPGSLLWISTGSPAAALRKYKMDADALGALYMDMVSRRIPIPLGAV